MWLGDPKRSTRRIIQSHSPPVFLGQVQSLILREADLIQPSRRSGDDHHSTHQLDEFTRLAMMSFLTFCGNFLGICNGNVASRIFLGKILSPFWSSYKMDIPWRTMAPEFFLDRSTRLATPAEFAPRISGSRWSIVWAKILVGPSTCIFANSYGKYHMNINYSCIGKYTTRWWFQIIFYFHPYLGKVSSLTNIFQRGWNHQPDKSNGSYMDGHPPKIWT